MTKVVDSQPKPPKGACLWPLSLEAYHALGEAGLIPKNTELLHGFVYTKMSKSPLHSALVRRLARLMKQALPPGFFLDTEQPISCGDSEPEPDIAVISGPEEQFWHAHPKTAELIVEVCVTSHDYDRLKLDIYAAAGVKECWFVLGPEKQIAVYRQPRNNRYSKSEIYGPGGSVTSSALPMLSLNLDSLFAQNA